MASPGAGEFYAHAKDSPKQRLGKHGRNLRQTVERHDEPCPCHSHNPDPGPDPDPNPNPNLNPNPPQMRSFIREGMKAANKHLSHMLHLLALEQALLESQVPL